MGKGGACSGRHARGGSLTAGIPIQAGRTGVHTSPRRPLPDPSRHWPPGWLEAPQYRPVVMRSPADEARQYSGRHTRAAATARPERVVAGWAAVPLDPSSLRGFVRLGQQSHTEQYCYFSAAVWGRGDRHPAGGGKGWAGIRRPHLRLALHYYVSILTPTGLHGGAEALSCDGVDRTRYLLLVTVAHGANRI